MPHVTKTPPPNAQLGILAIVVMLLCVMVLMQSCSSEKKALKPYKAVVADVSEDYKEKKLELIAKKCNDVFPVKVQTIIKDSIVTKVMKVQDNAKINQLKKLLEKCNSKEINIDSIYNTLPFDTIVIERWRTKESVIKDTIANYRLAVENGRLKDSFALYSANFISCQKDYKELQLENETMIINESKLGYSAKLFFGNLWDSIKWWLLAIAVLYGIYRLLKLRFTLPF